MVCWSGPAAAPTPPLAYAADGCPQMSQNCAPGCTGWPHAGPQELPKPTTDFLSSPQQASADGGSRQPKRHFSEEPAAWTKAVLWPIMAEDWDRRGSTRAAVTTMVRTAGVVVVLAAALGVLYLSFRGTSGHGAPGHAAVGSSSGWSSTGGGPFASAVPAATAAGPAAPHTTNPPKAAAHASPLGPAVQSYLSGRSGTV